MATCILRPVGAIGIVATTLVALSDAGIGGPLNIVRVGDCLSAPNSPAPAGEHWYYHIDWAKHRNCWYLRTESAQQIDAQLTSEVAPAIHTVFSKPPASAVAKPFVANQINKAKEMITAKLGNPASIKFPDIAPGKAVHSFCGVAEVTGESGEAKELPFAYLLPKNEVYIIDGSDDRRASTAIRKMCN